MDDINVVLLKRKQEKERLKQRKDKIARLRYEREKQKIAQAEEVDQPTLRDDKHKRFYESLFGEEAKTEQNGPKATVLKKQQFVKKEEPQMHFNQQQTDERRHPKRRYKLTKKGQPIMKHKINALLSKIKKS